MPLLIPIVIGLGGSFALGYGTSKTTDKWLNYVIVLGAGYIAYKAVSRGK